MIALDRSDSASSDAGHVTARRPSPTASTAPTRDRTIDQQKASALTNAVRSSPSCTHSKRCRSRIVVAPSRRRQNAAKSRRPSSLVDASFITATSTDRGHPTTKPRRIGDTPNRAVDNRYS